MDKNTITGLVLIVAVLFGFSYYSSKQHPAERPQAVAETPAAPFTPTPAATAAATQADTTALFTSAVTADSAAGPATITLQNDEIKVVIDEQGGAISDVYLKNYKDYDDFHNKKEGAMLHLYDHRQAALSFTLKTTAGVVDTRDYRFTTIEQRDSTAVTLALTARNDSNARLLLTYELTPGAGYLLTCRLGTPGLSRYLASEDRHLGIHWNQKIRQTEKGYDFENQYSTLTYKLTDGGTEKLKETGSDTETPEGGVDWIAFKNQYFSSVLIAPAASLTVQNLHSEQITPEVEKGYLKNYDAQMTLPLATDAQQTSLQFFFGPNSFNLLRSMDQYKLGEKDFDLEGLVYLGWPIIKWINRFFTIYVFDFLTKLGLPMGIVLLLITLLLRVIVYVPTRKSFLSSAKMRVLKPKIDALNKKYPNKDDAMKKQQEMMTLYSQYGVSPMGGCLPMLIQMPIWIAMFNFVPNAIELRQQGFLWAEDLSTYDSIIDFGTHIWGIGDHLSLFCLLFCGTNLLYSYMSVRQQRESMSGEQAEQMKVMQWMMYFMPLMFFFMFNRYSAGLNYYYFISLLFSAGTMWYLRKTTDDAKILAQLEANYRANQNNPNKKASGLAARLEALNKQAAMMDAERARREGKQGK